MSGQSLDNPITDDTLPKLKEMVNHPAHYGGDLDPFECIKVIEAWHLGFNLGNALKYICRGGKKSRKRRLEDIRKAIWYLQREVDSTVGKV